MQINRPAPAEEHPLTDSAHELQRAAGNLQKHAADADQVPTHAVTLAHVEEALDRLSVGMLQMANGVVDWNAEHGRSVGEDDLPPQAQALCFHLRAVADALRGPRDACTSSLIWTRRLLDACSEAEPERSTHGAEEPDAALGSNRPTPQCTTAPR